MSNLSSCIPPPAEITIRRAKPRESNALTGLAHDAKRHWGYPKEWLRAWKNDLTIKPGFIRKNVVFIAEAGRTKLGFYALSRVKHHFLLDHLWVAPPRIRTGVGKELFQHAIQKAASLNAAIIEIRADRNAEGFYRRMGAK
jgi:GNAT superfamily N-acetyltransferase